MRRMFLAAVATLLLVPGIASARTDVDTAVAKRYVVVFNQPSGLPNGAEAAVAAAGGSVVVATEQIGALLAESADPAFATTLAQDARVKAVDENETVSIPELDANEVEPGDADNNGGTYAPPGPDPQPGTEPLYHKQWDKMRVNASGTGSYAVQQGHRAVRVAILDTGLEITHPDLVPNLNFAESRAFVSPAGNDIPADPDPAMWDDKHGHGSWCGSAVASPINGFGISGVAPNVELVALKVLGDTGRGSFFGVARALVYAGDMRMDVASMSLSGVLRHADQETNAVYVVIQRAIEYARSQGVLPIAAMGNANWDLADGAFFRDFVVSPVEHAGVVGVTATGYYNEKSFYSSYGVGKADVTAPGGATRYQNPPPPYESLGRVLGAWAPESAGTLAPVQREEQCAPPTDPTGACHYYAYIQGTSMATPNAAGVAALIISQYGGPTRDDPWYMSPTSVESLLQTTANNQPCPEPREVFYPDIPGFSEFRPNTATCQGDTGYNGFYGKGMVDAVKAVTFKP